eukprot:SAG11_NODE_36326_length_262_cov_0.631902_1_plen_27_part_01
MNLSLSFRVRPAARRALNARRIFCVRV